MSEKRRNVYNPSDEEAEAIGNVALRYILDGTTSYEREDGTKVRLPLEFKGAVVFGIAGILRETEEKMLAEPPTLELNEVQYGRLEEIEAGVTEALEAKLQYYPFGNDTERYESRGTVGPSELTNSSWGVTTNRHDRSITAAANVKSALPGEPFADRRHVHNNRLF